MPGLQKDIRYTVVAPSFVRHQWVGASLWMPLHTTSPFDTACNLIAGLEAQTDAPQKAIRTDR